MEDALVQDLVPFIDSHYRTYAHATERAIGGLSMGGYGAVNIALHHPDIFHKVMSVGGYFQAEGPLFGPVPASNAYRQLNSPSLWLQTSKGKQNGSQLEVVLGVGTTDGRYYHEGLAFYRQLLTMKISVRLLTTIGGHSWTLWARQFGESLPLLEHASFSHAKEKYNTLPYTFCSSGDSLKVLENVTPRALNDVIPIRHISRPDHT